MSVEFKNKGACCVDDKGQVRTLSMKGSMKRLSIILVSDAVSKVEEIK